MNESFIRKCNRAIIANDQPAARPSAELGHDPWVPQSIISGLSIRALFPDSLNVVSGAGDNRVFEALIIDVKTSWRYRRMGVVQHSGC